MTLWLDNFKLLWLDFKILWFEFKILSSYFKILLLFFWAVGSGHPASTRTLWQRCINVRLTFWQRCNATLWQRLFVDSAIRCQNVTLNVGVDVTTTFSQRYGNVDITFWERSWDDILKTNWKLIDRAKLWMDLGRGRLNQREQCVKNTRR